MTTQPKKKKKRKFKQVQAADRQNNMDESQKHVK